MCIILLPTRVNMVPKAVVLGLLFTVLISQYTCCRCEGILYFMVICGCCYCFYDMCFNLYDLRCKFFILMPFVNFDLTTPSSGVQPTFVVFSVGVWAGWLTHARLPDLLPLVVSSYRPRMCTTRHLVWILVNLYICLLTRCLASSRRTTFPV